MFKQSAVERLEPRRLLAANLEDPRLADYEPSSNGLAWHYTGRVDGEKAAMDLVTVRTSASLTYAGKIKTSSGTSAIDTRSLIGQTDAGSLSTSETLANGDRVTYTYAGKPNELPASVQIGTVVATFKLGVTEKITTSAGFVSVLSGTQTQNEQVTGAENFVLDDGRYVFAIEIVSDRTRTLSGKLNGVSVNITDRVVTTTWYARGIGPVRIEGTDDRDVINAADGIDNSTETNSLFSVASATLLPPPLTITLDSDHNLSITGSAGNDSISLLDDIDPKDLKTQVVDVYTGEAFTSYPHASVRAITIACGAGDDFVSINHYPGVYVGGGDGNDSIVGGPGDDTLSGGAGKDLLDGGQGNDRLNGNGGHDHLVGGEGSDRLYGGDGNDTLEGNAGTDRLWGGAGDDLLTGGASNDKLFGEDGNDTLFGGTENDLLDGGPGSDSLNGGSGNDTFFATDSTPDQIDGGDAITGNDSVTSDGIDSLINI